MDIKAYAPIALFTYDRPEHTKLTVEALLENKLAADSELFIFSDEPKNEKSNEGVGRVRDYIHTIKGFKNVEITERESNYGLAKSITDGVTSVCNIYGRVIVLEDDLVTSRYFLRYMNEALEAYQNEEAVISIHGYMFPVKGSFPETYFLKGVDCWGWATWKRGWDLFEHDGNKLLSELRQRGLGREFDFNGSHDYIKMLEGKCAGKNDSWAVLWYASAFLKEKLTLWPGKSLIQNIGNDSSGTNVGNTNIYHVVLADEPITVNSIPIEENVYAKKQIEHFFRITKMSFAKRIIRKAKQFF